MIKEPLRETTEAINLGCSGIIVRNDQNVQILYREGSNQYRVGKERPTHSEGSKG